MTDTLLPWHTSHWQYFAQARHHNRLPHALLLCGPKGMGKRLFAQQMANSLLCERPLASWQACGQCQSCHLFTVGNHPDVITIQPPETGKQIPIDAIRGLLEFCTLTTHYARYQVVIIEPAEAMNRNAANSLLKLLEEPPAKTVLLLVSQQPLALLATIRSRCQRVDFSHPTVAVTQAWLQSKIPPSLDTRLLLKLTAGAPLAALALVESEGMAQRQALFNSIIQLLYKRDDPIRIAEQWHKWDLTQVLTWSLSWTLDLIRLATCEQPPDLSNPDYREPLHQLAKNLNCRRLFAILDLQRTTYQLMMSTTNVRPQGLLENLAIAWTELMMSTTNV